MASAKDENPSLNHFAQLTATLPSIAGMRQAGNPASIPPYLFRWIENGAMRGTDLVERGGQARYNPDFPLEDCGDGFLPPDEEPQDANQRLLIQATGTGDDETEPTDLRLYASGVTEIASDLLHPCSLSYIPGAGAGGAGGRLMWGARTDSDEFQTLLTEFALTVSDKEAVLGETLTGAAAGVAGEAREFDGALFVVTTRDGEGTAVRNDPFDSSGGAVETSFGGAVEDQAPWLREFAGRLCCPVAPTVIYQRGTGSAGWDSVTGAIAGGVANTYRPHCAAVFEDHLGVEALYFAGGTGSAGLFALFRLLADGTVEAVTQFSSLVVPDPAANHQSLCVHNGVLWMGDQDGIAYLRPDHTLVEGAHTFPVTVTGALRQLISHQGRLWALRGDELWYSRFPHKTESWIRASAKLGAFGAAVVHPIE